MSVEPNPENNPGVNWRHVGAFLGLTFGLTYLLDLAIYLGGGLAAPGMVTKLQMQMLLPAFSAIVLGLFFFPESPIYYRRPAGKGRWFYYFFLLLTVVYALGVLSIWHTPSEDSALLLGLLPQMLAYLGLIVLIVLRFVAGKELMARVKLSWGNWRYWLVIGLGIVAFYVLQAGFNAFTGLGPVKLETTIPTPPGLTPVLFQALAGVQSVLLAPIFAIVIAFGEEYGWRGYLQSELVKLGRVRGILLLGLIWGVWHWPIILMGWSYPGYPLLGLLLTVLFLVGFAVVLGFAVLKTGSVLMSSYLHALNNQTTAFLVALGFTPFNPVFSFGVGIYGTIMLLIIALLVLRNPIWQQKPA